VAGGIETGAELQMPDLPGVAKGQGYRPGRPNVVVDAGWSVCPHRGTRRDVDARSNPVSADPDRRCTV